MIPAYNGPEPYIFVSYAHKDSAEVYSTIEKLSSLGYRIWYDEGIKPGVEWPENIAEHLDKCSLFMMFISPNSMASANCRREINFALSRSKKFLCIILTKTEIPLGMELQLASQQSIFRYKYSSEEAYIYKICSAAGMSACKEKHFFADGAIEAAAGVAPAVPAGGYGRGSVRPAASQAASAGARKSSAGGRSAANKRNTSASKRTASKNTKKSGVGTVVLGLLIGAAIIAAFISYMMGNSGTVTDNLALTPTPEVVSATPIPTEAPAPTQAVTQQTQVPGGTSTNVTAGQSTTGQPADTGNADTGNADTGNTNDNGGDVAADTPAENTDVTDNGGADTGAEDAAA